MGEKARLKPKNNSANRDIFEEIPQSNNAVQNGFIMKKKVV